MTRVSEISILLMRLTFTGLERLIRHANSPRVAAIGLCMDPTIPANFDEMRTTVSVQMRDGKEYSVRCDRPRGIWGNPLSREERLTKVRQCAARVLSDADIEQLIEIVENLEHASSQDLLTRMGLLAQSPAAHRLGMSGSYRT